MVVIFIFFLIDDSIPLRRFDELYELLSGKTNSFFHYRNDDPNSDINEKNYREFDFPIEYRKEKCRLVLFK